MTIFILADQSQRLRSQINLLQQLLNEKDNFQFVLFVSCENIEKDFKEVRDFKNLEIIYFKRSTIDYSKKDVKKEKNIFYNLIKHTTIGEISYVLIQYIKMKKYLKIAENYISKYNPDTLFVNGDRGSISLEQAFLKVANNNKIKSIVPYSSVISNGISLRMSNINSYLNRTLFDKLIFSIFPYTTKIVGNKQIVFYDAPSTLVLNIFELLSKNPWMIGNGLVDYVCIDNRLSFNKYKNEILYPEKFKVIGDIEYDTLHKNSNFLDSRFQEKYKINKEEKIVIVALPQLAEHLILNWNEHWEEIDYIMNELTKLNINVLLSLHPKMNKNNYQYLESKYNCKILDEQLKEVIHHANLFIATNSSTVLWSTMLGIKTVILDYFNLDSSYFKDIKSIYFVKDKITLLQSVENMLNKKVDFTSDFELLSKDSIFDGNTIKKYINLIKEKNSIE